MSKNAPQIRFLAFERLPGVRAVLAHDVDNAFGRHVHGGLIFGLQDAGWRETSLARETALTPEGALFVIGPGAAHACRPAGPRMSYRAAAASLERLADAARQALGPGAVWPALDRVVILDPDLVAAADEFFALAASGGPVEEMEALLLEILCALALRFGDVPPSPEAARPAPEAVERAKAHLLARLTENVGLKELSRAARLSPFHLQREFVRHLGVSPREFTLRARVELASRLLAEGVGAAEAALAAGFCDQSHFLRHFKRLIGVSPGRFASDRLE